MMRRKVITASIFAAFCLTALISWTQAQTKVSETLFAYTAPAGWKVQTIPGMKYKIAFGKPANSFAPNINVVDEAFPGTVEKYADANERTLQKMLAGYKKLSRAPFVTSSNVKGVKLAAEQVQQGKKLRSIFYFFSTKSGPKLVVTCTSLASDGAKFDGAFDTAMKSFALK